MATILILGGTGFLGRNLASTLSSDGHRVLVGVRAERPSATTLPPGATAFPFHFGDLLALTAYVDRERPDAVLHLVSSLKPASTIGEYYREREEIITPTMRLAEHLAKRGIMFGYLSSGGAIYGPSSIEAVAETDPCEPISFYGQAKLEIETYLRFLGRSHGLRYLILRPSNPYGRYQDITGSQGLVSVVVGKALRSEPLQVWGDGGAVRDYIYVEDFAWTVARLIESAIEGTTLNVGSGIGHSLIEVVRIVERALGTPVVMEWLPPRSIDVSRVVLDVARVQALNAFRTRSLEDGIAAYVSEIRRAAGQQR